MQYEEIIHRLQSLSNPKAVSGMARYGINPDNTYGVSVPDLRKIAREAGKDHALAQQLWSSGIHEARILASMVDDPKQVTEEQMDDWSSDFDSWDVCDQCCMNLFDRTGIAYYKAVAWSTREDEFGKRAAFALIACLAWHDKRATDEQYEPFFPIITREANDNRNYVKKAVNWALRQIGKRNLALNTRALATAREIQQMDSKAAKWIASDAIKELSSQAVQERLKTKYLPR